MMPHSVNNNTCMHGYCYISLFKFKSFDQFNPPEQPQILDNRDFKQEEAV